jgi:hypothetical protein
MRMINVIVSLKMIYFAHVHSLMSYGIMFWGFSSRATKVFIMDVLNETNGCNNVENIYFFLELCQHVSGIIMPIIRIQMW